MNVYSPASVNVPESKPLDALSVSPGGRLPPLTVHESPVPFELRVWLYDSETVPPGSAEVVISSGLIFTDRVRDALAVPYTAVAVKLKFPEFVGVPEILPDESIASPAGRFPESVQDAPEGFDDNTAL